MSRRQVAAGSSPTAAELINESCAEMEMNSKTEEIPRTELGARPSERVFIKASTCCRSKPSDIIETNRFPSITKPLGLLLLVGDLLLLAAASSSSPALVAPTSSQQISLRQVLVPVVGGGGDQARGRPPAAATSRPPVAISPNNRPTGLAQAFAEPLRFGQRRRSDQSAASERRQSPPARALTWSQPDPRKSYSLPVALIKVARLGAATRRARPAPIRRLSEVSSSQPTGVNPAASADEAGDSRPEASFASARRANASRRNGPAPASKSQMVTLIKYLPVLMSVPAEQLVLSPRPKPPSSIEPVESVASEAASSSSSAPQAPVAYYGLVQQPKAAATKFQIVEAAEDGHEQQQQQRPYEASWPDIDAEYSQVYSSGGLLQPNELQVAPNGHHQLTRLAYIPVGQPTQLAAGTQATSKALAAYASKLISMLRPSALLSSIGSSTGYGGGQPASLSYGHPHAPQVFLLTPAEAGPTSRPIQQQQQQPARGKPEDLLLNQASKVYSTKQTTTGASGADNRLPPAMMNGLICLQGAFGKSKDQGQQQQQQQSQPIQQQQVASQTQEADLGSFDYASSDQSSKSPALGSKTANKSAGGRRSKDSPIRLMQKMAKKTAKMSQPAGGYSHNDYAGQPSKASSPADEDEPEPVQQQKLIGLSSESRSVVDGETPTTTPATATSQAGSRPQQPAQTAQHSARLPADGKSIIPFTIRDKMDLPAARARSAQQAGSQTNGPVQYDEPADGPPTVELAEERPRVMSSSYVWPHLGQDDRRSKTTFSGSSPTSNQRQQTRGQSPHNQLVEIDYRNEFSSSGSSQRGDFSMPLLMASSSRQQSKPPPTSTQSPSEPLTTTARSNADESPPFLRPSVVFKSAESLHSDGQLSAASSTSLTLTSTTSSPPATDSPGRLISSTSLNNNNNGSNNNDRPPTTTSRAESQQASQLESGSTLELVVNSTPEVVSSSTLATPTLGRGPSNGTSAQLVADEEHSPDRENENSFSNDRSLSMEEYGKVSASLQTNPLDLIDLQNSRSNFELPSQLESLSMMFPPQEHPTLEPTIASRPQAREARKQRALVGPLTRIE